MSTITYSLSGDFTSGLDVGQFQDEILASSITTTLIGITVVGDDVNVIFNAVPSGAEITTLNGLVAAHVPGNPVGDPAQTTTGDVITQLASTVAPTANDDDTQGYQAGSRWLDTVAEIAYICTDATTGAAVWKTDTGASGGGADYQLLGIESNAINTTFTTVASFPWLNSVHGSLTNGQIITRATIVDRNLNVRLRDITNVATLGSATITITGSTSFPVSNPVADAQVELQISKSASGGTNPTAHGVLLQYS